FTTSPPSAPFTLSLHDALPILSYASGIFVHDRRPVNQHPIRANHAVRARDLRSAGPWCQAIASNRAETFGSGRLLLAGAGSVVRSEEHTSELQSRVDLVCRLLL